MSEPERDQWGRYLIPDPRTGEVRPWQRATTLTSQVDDPYNIARWEERMMLGGLVVRPDLYTLVQASNLDDRKVMDDLVKEAKVAGGRDTKANLGTAMHRFTESIDNGEKAIEDIPAEHRRTVGAYVRRLSTAGLVVVSAEGIVVNTRLDIAGTYDRLVKVPDEELPVILDVKTGKRVDLSHLSHAAQLAAYANADYMYDQETDEVKPAPPMNKEWGIIAHLPVGQGKCILHILDLQVGYAAALLARELSDLRKLKGISTPW